MTDIKITNLPLGTDISDDDELLYIDVSDQTAGPDGTDKRVLVGSLRNIAERNTTTQDLIASDLSSFAVGKSITTVGFYESGDGGGAQWVKTADTDTPSQTPLQLGDVKFTDSDGFVWEFALGQIQTFINVKYYPLGFGDIGEGDYLFDGTTWDMITLNEDLNIIRDSIGAGVVGYGTQVELYADLDKDDKTIAYVTNDSTPSNNGTYRKIGASGTGSWEQSNDDISSQALQLASDVSERVDDNDLVIYGGTKVESSPVDFTPKSLKSNPDAIYANDINPPDGSSLTSFRVKTDSVGDTISVFAYEIVNETAVLRHTYTPFVATNIEDTYTVSDDFKMGPNFVIGASSTGGIYYQGKTQAGWVMTSGTRANIEMAQDFICTTNYIPLNTKIDDNTKRIDNIENSNIESIDHSTSDLGALDVQNIIPDGYNHIVFYGQSLSVGDLSYEPISTVPLNNCFMVGSSPRSVTGAFNPLVSVTVGNSGEQPVVGCVNALKSRTDRTYLHTAKYVGTCAGSGGKSIEILSKECTNTSSETTTDNLYTTRFVSSINQAKSNAGGDDISCPAIVWMQGEANQATAANSTLGLTKNPVSYQTDDKAEYKSLLMTLKNNMQSDIMSVYGQTKRPMFYIYQTSFNYVSNGDIPITQAQYEFARENDDGVLLNPHYYVTTQQATGGHLNANGYRWYSEQVAKSIFGTLCGNKNVLPVTPESFRVNGDTIYIDLHVPVKPIVVDTYTTQEVSNYGFKVDLNGVDILDNVSIYQSSTLMLKCNQDIGSATGLSVMYAGSNSNGKGNIRDSSTEYSFSTYVDDTTLDTNTPPYTPVDRNGDNYYGRRYPLFNWLSNFNIEI